MKTIWIYMALCVAFLLFGCSDNKNEEGKTTTSSKSKNIENKQVTPSTRTMMAPSRKERKSSIKTITSHATSSISNNDDNISYFTVSDKGESDNNRGTVATTQKAEAKISFPKKLVKTGDIRMQVDDYISARHSIMAIAAKYHGYISSENETSSEGIIENKIVIRAEGRNFDSIVENTSSISKKTEHKEVSSDDINSEYYDLENRLKTEKEIEKKYLEMLSHAKKVDEMMEVQQKIDEINEEIESKEGQQRVLNDQVDYSTLNLDFYQKLPEKPAVAAIQGPGFFHKIIDAVVFGWYGILAVIVSIISIWPLVVAGLFALLFWKRNQMKKARKNEKDYMENS